MTRGELDWLRIHKAVSAFYRGSYPRRMYEMDIISCPHDLECPDLDCKCNCHSEEFGWRGEEQRNG